MRKPSNVVMPLIIVNVIVFVAQMILGPGFTEMFLLDPSRILTQPWILVTSMFLHANGNHLFFNMYGLLIFGPLLEQRIGSKRFMTVYFGTGILAAIGHVVLSILLFGEAQRALGASGAIMGMIGALIILMPNLRLLFFFLIPMPLWVAGIVWAGIDFMMLFFDTSIANLAHLVGMGSGLLYGLYMKNQRTNYRRGFSGKTHMDLEDVEDYLKYGRI